MNHLDPKDITYAVDRGEGNTAFYTESGNHMTLRIPFADVCALPDMVQVSEKAAAMIERCSHMRRTNKFRSRRHRADLYVRGVARPMVIETEFFKEVRELLNVCKKETEHQKNMREWRDKFIEVEQSARLTTEDVEDFERILKTNRREFRVINMVHCTPEQVAAIDAFLSSNHIQIEKFN